MGRPGRDRAHSSCWTDDGVPHENTLKPGGPKLVFSDGPRSVLAWLFKPTASIETPVHFPTSHPPPPLLDRRLPPLVALPPCRRVRSYPYLTSERRLQILEYIRARRKVRIAAGLPPNTFDPEGDLQVEEEEVEGEEEDVGDNTDTDLQAEQQAILDSLRLESEAEAKCRRRQEAEAKCRRRQEAEAKHATEVDEMLAYMDDEEELKPSFAPIYPLPANDVVDISDDEA